MTSSKARKHGAEARGGITFTSAIVQILILDIIFSLDSVITAVGMVQTPKEHHWIGLTIMIIAVVLPLE